jgi:DNA-binding beta-propeller fold protein YncE
MMYTVADAEHFFAQPSALAFGAPNEFATIHETNAETQEYDPNLPDVIIDPVFMGPVLQTTDRTFYTSGGQGHLDMLHNTPLGMGIAWEKNRVYWVFDGFHSSITRYNFNTDHGPAGADHEDGNVARYIEGEVKRNADIPSHMEFDPETDLLYIADTGNNRILVLDTTTGKAGGPIQPNFDGGGQYYINNAESWTLVEGADVGMEAPSGLALYQGMVVVSDNQNSTIYAFDLQDGSKVDWLDTELPSGSLMGIDFDSTGDLWLVDALANQVLRIQPRP